jgi:hypothetical protein
VNPVRKQRLKRALKRQGVKRPGLVIACAKREKLKLEYALAMLQKETGIPQRNIFGCDWGAGQAFCHLRVTPARVKALIESGRANGVGWTQLTWPAFVLAAQQMAGGAANPRNQMRVGFRVLSGNIRQYGAWEGFRMYNGSGTAAAVYANEATQFADTWRNYINREVP